MASLIKRPNGTKLVQFADPFTKDRRTLRLGKMTTKQGNGFREKLEKLIAGRKSGTALEPSVTEWVRDLDDSTANKLAEWGLIKKRVKVALQRNEAGEVIDPRCLGPFLDQYFAKRADVKPATQTVYRRVKRHLIAHFGLEKRLDEITSGDADDWQLYLKGKGLAENTVRRHIGCARQFFKSARRHKMIRRNPFLDLKASLVETPDRMYFVTAADTYKVLDACPDVEYRLIVALARFGGLRTPSETFALEWQHVNWEAGRITIPSPKTEHHAGHESRVIPIFPELRPYLEAVWDSPTSEGAKYVITSYRDAKKNLRTRFERVIQRAGLKPWPRLFQNLRSSRETELGDLFPIQVVVSWIGNSERVARKSYLQVTEGHFQKGLNMPSAALQKALQLMTESPFPDQAGESRNIDFPSEYDTVRDGIKCSVGGTGLEPVTPSV